MIKSMTGFGRAIFKNSKEEIIVELKSVNHRFLEINFKSSEAEHKVEEYVKNKISTKVKRGKIDASIKISTCLLYTSPSPRDATLSRMPSSA